MTETSHSVKDEPQQDVFHRNKAGEPCPGWPLDCDDCGYEGSYEKPSVGVW